MTYYCKVCGSDNIQLKKIKRGISQSEGGEISGGLPVLKSKINDSHGTIHEIESEDYCCNICLNEGIKTEFVPISLLEEGTNRQLILIPENLNNTLSKLEITGNAFAKMIEEKEQHFMKCLNNFIQYGRNTCKDYRVGERVLLKVPRIDNLLVWIIVEWISGHEIFRLSFGGGDVICQ